MTGSSGYYAGDLGALLKSLMIWATIGALATIGGVIWLIVWAVRHVSIGVS